MTEQITESAIRLFKEVWNERRLEVVEELIAANYRNHDPSAPPELQGAAGFRQQVEGYIAAFPDIRMTVEDYFAAADKVTVRWTARGTHQGALMGVSATGRPVTVSGITIWRFAGGRAVEGWTNWDTSGMWRQLGVKEMPG